MKRAIFGLVIVLLLCPSLSHARAVAESLQVGNRHSSVVGTDITWVGAFDVGIDSLAATAGADSCNVGAAAIIRFGKAGTGATQAFRRIGLWFSLGTAWSASYALDSSVVDLTIQATSPAVTETLDVYCLANLPLIEGAGTSVALFASGPCWKARDWQAGAGADVLWGATGCNLAATFPEWSVTIPTTVDRGRFPVASIGVPASTVAGTVLSANITPIMLAALAGRVPMGVFLRGKSEADNTLVPLHSCQAAVATNRPRLRMYGHTTTTGIQSGGGSRRNRHPGVQR